MWASTDDGNRIRLLLAVNSILALLRWHRGEPKIKKKKKGGDKREDVGGRGRKKKWKEQRKEEEQRRGGVRGKRKKFAKRDKLCQCWMSVWVELVNEQTLEFFSASTASANQRTNSSLSLRRERRHTHATYTHTHTHTRTHTHTHAHTKTTNLPSFPLIPPHPTAAHQLRCVHRLMGTRATATQRSHAQHPVLSSATSRLHRLGHQRAVAAITPRAAAMPPTRLPLFANSVSAGARAPSPRTQHLATRAMGHTRTWLCRPRARRGVGLQPHQTTQAMPTCMRRRT